MKGMKYRSKFWVGDIVYSKSFDNNPINRYLIKKVNIEDWGNRLIISYDIVRCVPPQKGIRGVPEKGLFTKKEIKAMLKEKENKNCQC